MPFALTIMNRVAGWDSADLLNPCQRCGAHKFWFDGDYWCCWTCIPCQLRNPITAELDDGERAPS